MNISELISLRIFSGDRGEDQAHRSSSSAVDGADQGRRQLLKLAAALIPTAAFAQLQRKTGPKAPPKAAPKPSPRRFAVGQVEGANPKPATFAELWQDISVYAPNGDRAKTLTNTLVAQVTKARIGGVTREQIVEYARSHVSQEKALAHVGAALAATQATELDQVLASIQVELERTKDQRVGAEHQMWRLAKGVVLTLQGKNQAFFRQDREYEQDSELPAISEGLLLASMSITGTTADALNIFEAAQTLGQWSGANPNRPEADWLYTLSAAVGAKIANTPERKEIEIKKLVAMAKMNYMGLSGRGMSSTARGFIALAGALAANTAQERAYAKAEAERAATVLNGDGHYLALMALSVLEPAGKAELLTCLQPPSDDPNNGSNLNVWPSVISFRSMYSVARGALSRK